MRLHTKLALYAIHGAAAVAIKVLDACAYRIQRMTGHLCSYGDNLRCFDDAVSGARRGTFVIGITCTTCNGRGGFGMQPCDDCGGTWVHEFVTPADLARGNCESSDPLSTIEESMFDGPYRELGRP